MGRPLTFDELYSHGEIISSERERGGTLNVTEAIRTKRAVRTFQARPLPQQVVREILNAGRRAQSSKNEQAWRFIAIQDRPTLEALSTCGRWATHLAAAALGVAILTPDPTAKFQTMFDAGQAAALMQLAAWELGVGSCPASIYEPEKARALLMFPAEWHLRIALSFGYPVDDEEARTPASKGGRRDFAEVVHFDRW
jgi:nitroreductase